MSKRGAQVASAETAILHLLETFTDGWNRRDLAAVASPFSEEADFITVTGLWWRGRAEIAERHRTRFRPGRLNSEGVSIRFLRPDVAVVHLQWESGGGKGILTFLASEENGRWQFDAAQNTDILVA
jgi:uncharacterized protein (TIGR02246 family)